MSSSKAALKSIKSSLDAGDFSKAADQAQGLVEQDPQNQIAFLFLGFAREKLGNLEAAEKAIQAALRLKPQDPQAYKGLITLYEKQGNAKLDQYHDIAHDLAKIYSEQEDQSQCQNVIEKYEIFAKKHGSRHQYRNAMELMLPTCDLYDALEGRVPQPHLLYQRILESAESEEKEWVNTQIGERRTRLGAKIDQVTLQVKNEAIDKFKVEDKYAALIDWTRDDDSRHDLEQKLFQRMLENLVSLPADLKPSQKDKVLNMANGMVIIKQQFPLAWKIALEWVDAEDLQDWDPNIFWQYIEFFPDDGLSKVLRGFLNSAVSPYPKPAQEENGDEKNDVIMSEADQLILMTEGLEDAQNSLLAHRIMAFTYLNMEEYESSVDMARKSRKLYQDFERKYAAVLNDSIDGVNLILANALITYQSPRHHPEAKSLFQDILVRKPKLTSALLGIGLIFEEDEDYREAVTFLKQAAERDPENTRIRLELAWCRAQDNDLEVGLSELEDVLAAIEGEKQPNLIMKSEALYRIAYCKWHLNTSSSARKDKSGPYMYLIASVKANPAYAPAYTLLGIYFQDYGKSKQRARVALQKAFELSTSELEAARRLAKAFADDSEWDLVELVAQRVVSSGKARPAPGSKRKAFSWPYAALGVVQMNKQQYSQSIVSFQAALRISPEDYHSWVGLGESYHNAGRYIAAARAYAKAESIDHGLPIDQTWFAKYMLANVQREMGSFDEAIAAYEAVLVIKPGEFGVLIALLQCLAENAWAKLTLGMFGEATRLAKRVISVGQEISTERVDIFNLWKGIGDACSVLGLAKAFAGETNLDDLATLLQKDLKAREVEILQDIDKSTMDSISPSEEDTPSDIADRYLIAAIMSYKRAIDASSSDIHAQAVSWYNLGWAEYQAHTQGGNLLHSKGKKSNRYLKAAMKGFKRAIEFEAGNAEFWNALGVVTMTLSPKVSQHSFVRSLHLNENSARVWTDIGVLYLVNNDNQLANEAFTRAQSVDPEYAEAWLGQGLLATLFGNFKEARGLFMHAFEIADSISLPSKRQFAMSAFDHLLKVSGRSEEINTLLQPLFALRQLHSLVPTETVSSHLMAHFAERIGDYNASVAALEEVCAKLEAEYEKTETIELLARFAQAKADLARSQLGQNNFQNAIINAEVALDLSTEEDDTGADYGESRRKWRLSAHLTAGLAHSHLKATDQSIKMFEAALTESQGEPDVVCMLAQMLWAKGGHEEREIARSQLFDCIENHPGHVQSIALLAVIGLLDSDEDVLEAVEDDLKALRSDDRVTIADKFKITKVLAGIISCKHAAGQTDNKAVITDAVNSIMLAPGQPQGWLELSQAAGNEYAAEMAVFNARRLVPPGGNLSAEELARTFANTGRSVETLQAKMLAPWLIEVQ